MHAISLSFPREDMNRSHRPLSNIRCPCMHAKLLLHVWLIATPWTVVCQAPLSVGSSRQEYWSGLPSRGSPRPWDWTHITCSSCIHEPPGEAHQTSLVTCFSFQAALGWWRGWGKVMTSSPGGASLSPVSNPGLINLGQAAGLFCLETHVSDWNDSSERPSLMEQLSSGGTNARGGYWLLHDLLRSSAFLLHRPAFSWLNWTSLRCFELQPALGLFPTPEPLAPSLHSWPSVLYIQIKDSPCPITSPLLLVNPNEGHPFRSCRILSPDSR